MEQLVNEVPQVIAFKDGRADVRLFVRIRDHIVQRFGADRLVWLGGSGDDLVGPVLRGRRRRVHFVAGLFLAGRRRGDLPVGEQRRLCRAGRLPQPGGAADLHDAPTEARLRGLGDEGGDGVAGIHRRSVRPPLANVTDAERDELKAILSGLDIPTRESRLSTHAVGATR